MTTFTSEDRVEAYKNDTPTVIVDNGYSVKTLGDYIDLEQRIEMYRKQMDVMQMEIEKLKQRLSEAGIND
jgi:hypothetical protein